MMKDKCYNSNLAFAFDFLEMRELSHLFSCFLQTSLDRCNFSARINSLSHKVPSNWREIDVAKSEDIRKLFNEEKVKFLLEVDEAFLRCHKHGLSGEV